MPAIDRLDGIPRHDARLSALVGRVSVGYKGCEAFVENHKGSSPLNGPTSETEDQVKTAFMQFRQKPAYQLWVRLRQQRASELRRLLSHPADIDLDTFNRDVWVLESSSSINGKDTTNLFSRWLPIHDAALPELEEALSTRSLEFHGNSIWGSATNVFAPMLKESAEEKTAYIHRALSILNSDIAPLQKAKEIIKIKGFGENVATGLVMVFHPTEFALCNTPSKEALRRIGFDVSTLESFESGALELRRALDANDFIELDAFLYDLGQNGGPIGGPEISNLWWVNQGRTYEIESAGGYIWAPKTNFYYHQNVGRVRVGDIIVHYAHQAIQAVSRVTVSAIEAARPGETDPENQKVVGYLARTRYHELSSTIGFSSIPAEMRIPSNKPANRNDTSIQGHLVPPPIRFVQAEMRNQNEQPFNRNGSPIQGYLFRLPMQFVQQLVGTFPRDWPDYMPTGVPEPGGKPVYPPTGQKIYVEPSFDVIMHGVRGVGFRVTERTLRRYHLSLKTRGFVILSGVSGTGKTWLTKAYADAIGAEQLLVPVAPNWTTNEDLLGYFNPLDNAYYDTDFSRFLRRAAAEFQSAVRESRTPKPYHLVLDEMNLARVEYYFAKFLSTMETRMRGETALVGLGPNEEVLLCPNLFFIGTVNVDETTHGFANKVYDRAQLLELQVDRADLERHIGEEPYRDLLMRIWSITELVAPFAYRIVDEIKKYVAEAELLGVDWSEAFDEQLLQKVLPKLKGTDLRVGAALEQFVAATQFDFPLSSTKAKEMADGYRQHGFASYF